eukprot:6182312-Pleurochrysis_carterae.AAC.2
MRTGFGVHLHSGEGCSQNSASVRFVCVGLQARSGLSERRHRFRRDGACSLREACGTSQARAVADARRQLPAPPSIRARTHERARAFSRAR